MSSVRPASRPEQDRCTTPDGIGIAVYDFGGQGPDLLFVHAAGFCAQVFAPMIPTLHDRFRCWGLDLRGHGRSSRPADGVFKWSGFATDVLAVVDHLDLEPPLGFGHSCGGAALLLAEEARPGTFSSMYCFDPVVTRDSIVGDEVANSTPMSEGARRRRDIFPSTDEAFANFSSKAPFGDFDPESLWSYVENGFELVPVEEGGDGRSIRLRCRRADEAEIYANGGSHGAFDHLHEVGCPVALACGEHFDFFGPSNLDQMAGELQRVTVEVMPGLGHFGPMQQPTTVASSVLAALSTDDVTPSS